MLDSPIPVRLPVLDPEQLRAVTAPGGGPIIVAAGAGSGKTRTLTARIAYLLSTGADPSGIVAITFTRKAANEMRERLALMTGRRYDTRSSLRVGTFHSLCATALRREPTEALLEATGRSPRFTIWDESDREKAIRGLLRNASLDVPPAGVAALISAAKNDLSGRAALRSQGEKDPIAHAAATIWNAYERTLITSDAADFDDLLLLPLRLFARDKEVRIRWSSAIESLLVDEFQDTNAIQVALISAFVSVHGDLFVVGDDAQAIYSFRGARIEHFRNFAEHFTGAKRYEITTNYRSTDAICSTANALLAVATDARHVILRSDPKNGIGQKPTLRRFETEREEARFLAAEMVRRTRRGEDPNGLAIFVRTNAQTRPIEAALTLARIGYRLLGGPRFWERREVRDLVAHAKTLVFPRDLAAFHRALGSPPRGIGGRVIAVADAALTEGLVSDYPSALRYAAEAGAGNAASRRAIEKYLAFYARFSAAAETEDLPRLLLALAKESGLLASITETAADEEEAANRSANIGEVANAAMGYPTGNLAGFLEDTVLEGSGDTDHAHPGSGLVTIATLHAAKGLEWNGVYLTGIEEGFLPHARSTTLEEAAEERRLAYVGVTRARRTLVFTCAATRAVNGRTEPRIVSRYVRDMRPTLGTDLP